MDVIRVSDYGRDLASRQRARDLRQSVFAAGTARLDFEGVRSVSHSFADELLGVIVAERGLDWLRLNIELANAAPAVRDSIEDAVGRRLSKQSSAVQAENATT